MFCGNWQEKHTQIFPIFVGMQFNLFIEIWRTFCKIVTRTKGTIDEFCEFTLMKLQILQGFLLFFFLSHNLWFSQYFGKFLPSQLLNFTFLSLQPVVEFHNFLSTTCWRISRYFQTIYSMMKFMSFFTHD